MKRLGEKCKPARVRGDSYTPAGLIACLSFNMPMHGADRPAPSCSTCAEYGRNVAQRSRLMIPPAFIGLQPQDHTGRSKPCRAKPSRSPMTDARFPAGNAKAMHQAYRNGLKRPLHSWNPICPQPQRPGARMRAFMRLARWRKSTWPRRGIRSACPKP